METRETQAAALADAISGTLRLARALVLSGRHVDLAGLDADVARLCAACLDLPPAQGRRLSPRLAAILADLDTLRATLAETPK
jgi:hypothetical protein